MPTPSAPQTTSESDPTRNPIQRAPAEDGHSPPPPPDGRSTRVPKPTLRATHRRTMRPKAMKPR